MKDLLLNYCSFCKLMVEYEKKEEELNEIINGKEYLFLGEEAYCSKCGNKIFISSLLESNKDKFSAAYRKTEGLISKEEIDELKSKYSIKDISERLFVSEEVLLRYFQKYDIPSRRISKLLRKLNGGIYGC